MKTIRYIGLEKTRQIWGRWLTPGELIADPGMVDALEQLPDFEIVDTTLDKEQAEAVAAVDESEG
jgi:hypothetical protein